MEKQSASPQMHDEMARDHYLMLGVNLVISLVIMYFVMFTMIWNAGDLVNNVNMFYMALTMAAPMGILMLVMMGMMYPNQTLNRLLYALFALLFVLGFWGTRAQGFVGDRQFVRAMIPHPTMPTRSGCPVARSEVVSDCTIAAASPISLVLWPR